jgi:hypothetical protein
LKEKSKQGECKSCGFRTTIKPGAVMKYKERRAVGGKEGTN